MRLGIDPTTLEVLRVTETNIGRIKICENENEKKDLLPDCSEYTKLREVDVRLNRLWEMQDLSRLPMLRRLWMAGKKDWGLMRGCSFF